MTRADALALVRLALVAAAHAAVDGAEPAQAIAIGMAEARALIEQMEQEGTHGE